MKQVIQSIYSRYRYSLILLRQLVVTDFKLRYQGSALGYVWSLLRPLFMFAILYVVFVEFFRLGSDVPYFAVYLLLGIVLWNFFSEVTNAGVGAIVGKGDLLRKINFPKYVIVVAAAISALINLALNGIVIAIFIAINNVELSWSMLMAIPYIIELFLLSLSVALILSATFVRLRDINYIWEVLMQVMFYAAAIIYPFQMVIDRFPELAKVMLLNPISQIIQDIRYWLVTDQTTTVSNYVGGIWVLVPFALVIGIFIFAVYFFKKRAPYFAEEV